MEFIKKYLPPALIVIILLVVTVFLVSPENGIVNKDLDKTTWKTYTDEQYKFTLRYPEDRSAQKTGSRIVFFGVGEESKSPMEILVVENSDIEESKYSYLNFPQAGQVEIEGKKFTEFKAPSGYCEGKTCGRPFSAYSLKRNNNYIVTIFYENDKLSPQEKAILGGLVFSE